MPRQYRNLVSGQIGNVVFYVVNGVGYARAAAAKVKQTKATKKSAQLFGKSKRLGSILRGDITGVLPGLSNRQVMPKFDNAVLQWLRLENLDSRQEKLEYIHGFEFNPKSELSTRFKRPIEVDFNEKGKIHVNIPPFDVPSDIGAPVHTVMLQWHVIASSCKIKDYQYCGYAHDKLEMPFNPGPAAKQTITLNLEIQKGTVTVVVVALRYVASRRAKVAVLNEPAWLPTAVVGSYYFR